MKTLFFALALLLVLPAQSYALDQSEQCGANLKQENPFNKAPVPIQPPSLPAADASQLSDSDVKGLQYKECLKVHGYPCNMALGTALQLFYREKSSLDKIQQDVNGAIAQKLAECTTGQGPAQACAAKFYADVASKYENLAKLYGEHSTQLDTYASSLKEGATQLLNSTTVIKNPKAQPWGASYLTSADSVAESVDISPLRGANSRAQCDKNVSGSFPSFCGIVISSAESKYFARRFKDAQDLAAKTAQCYQKISATAQERAANTDTPTSDPNKADSTVTGGKSGMGLDDLMKLATIGMTGAGLYCTVTKSCSPSSASDSSTNTGTSGATSPTPNSTNGPETSSLGDSKSGGASSQPAPGPGAPDPGSSLGHYSGSGTGGSNDPALQHFSGALDSRAPASTPATPGGAGGGGSFASIGGNATSAGQPANGAGSEGSKAADASGNGMGGGGLPSGAASGGFSLGDPKAGSADSALKNILNGDMPTSTDASLFPANDPAAGKQAAAEGPEDPESLFARVKDTHVRCLKRGCVGQGVGENI